jgi:cytochrome P450
VLLPTIAKGAIIRRPTVLSIADRLQTDRRAVQRLARLRDRYGDGLVLLRLPARREAVCLAPDDARRVLDETPAPFDAASFEKRAALSHFQPHGVLISHGADRVRRRALNDHALESESPRHSHAEFLGAAVRDAAARMRFAARARRALDWQTFNGEWVAMIRRVVLGADATNDRTITDLLTTLRRDANWAFLRPKRTTVRARFLALVHQCLLMADGDSLGGIAMRRARGGDTAVEDQVAHWLFAFDAAGITAFRALALLATHPEQRARARAETGGHTSDAFPYLRACLLDTVRLWPTTPMILRQTTVETTLHDTRLPAGTGVLIFAPFFHRDASRLPFADRFAPEIWLDSVGAATMPEQALVPFSAGPAICPGRQIVLLLTSVLLGELLSAERLRLISRHQLAPEFPLPATLNHFTLRFTV